MWGCGTSPQPTGEPSLQTFASRVVEAMDQRAIGRFAVCGASMGGYVLWELLRQVAQRISRVALCSTRAVADTPEGRANRQALASRVKALGVETIVEENVSRLLSSDSQSEVHIADPLRARIRRCTPEGIAWASLAMGERSDSTELLGSIRVPALVVAGEEDAVIPSSDQRAMAQQIPGAAFASLEKCGHLVNLENPQQFSERLGTFLTG